MLALLPTYRREGRQQQRGRRWECQREAVTHIRLDSRHRLVYDIKAFCWTLQKCSPYAKFDQTKYDTDKTNGKRITIMQDSDGVQYFSKWIGLGTFTQEYLGDAFTTWINGLIDDKLGDKELSVKMIINTFNGVKKAISEMLLLSTLFRIKVEMIPVDAHDFDRLVTEEKRARKVVSADRKKIPPGGLVGPDTVFSAQILDRDAQNVLRTYGVNMVEGGAFDVTVNNNSTISEYKEHLSSFSKDGVTELVKVKKVGEFISLKGRQPGVKAPKEQKSDEVIVVNDKVKLHQANDPPESGKRGRGRPPGTKNKKKENGISVAATESPAAIIVPSDLKPKISALQPKTAILQPRISALKPKILSGKVD